MSDFDVVICGAGISGSCAALALAQRGLKVLLLEAGNFPRDKVCGEFLSPESRAIFERLKVWDKIADRGGVAISRARFACGRASTKATALPAPALGISRRTLDELLWNAAQEVGVLCRAEARVSRVERDAETFTVSTKDATFRARGVLDATGRARLTLHDEPQLRDEKSPRYFGLKAHFKNVALDDDLIELHFWRAGYCGLSRVEDGFTNVCLLSRYDEHNPQENAPGRVWERVLRLSPILSERLVNACQETDWIATANVRFDARAPLSPDGILRIGDAAGYIHPLAGDGMAMAARSGELAAAVLAVQSRGALSTSHAGELYQNSWRREFDARLRCADAIGACAQSPFFPALVKFLRRAPLLSQRLTSTLVKTTRGAIIIGSHL